MISNVVFLSLLMTACEDTTIVEEVKTEEVVTVSPEEQKKKLRKGLAVDIGNGSAAKVLEKLRTDTMLPDNQRTAIKMYAAAAIGFNGEDAGVFGAESDKTIVAWGLYNGRRSGSAADLYTTSGEITDQAISAGFRALAVLNGAKTSVDPSSEALSPSDHLELLMGKTAEDGTVHLEASSGLSSWTYHLAMAEWYSGQGMQKEAVAQYQKMAEQNAGLKKYVRANIAMMTSGEEAINEAKDVLGQASDSGDYVSGMIAASALIKAHLRKANTKGLWEDLTSVLDPTHQMKVPTARWEMLAIAKVALMTGDVKVGYALAKKLVDGSTGKMQQQAIWTASLLAAEVGNSDALKAMQANAQAVHLPWLQAFEQTTTGRLVENIDSLLSSGIGARDFVYATLILSRSCGECVNTLLPQALKKNLGPMQNLMLELVRDDYRLAVGVDNSANLSALEQAYSQFPNALKELAVRKSLYGKAATLSVSDEASDTEKEWGGLLAKQGSQSTSKERHVLALSNASKMIAAMEEDKKNIDGHLDQVWKHSPTHRVGGLSTGTALDMSKGFNVDPLIVKLSTATEERLTSSAVGVFELKRAVKSHSKMAFFGLNSLNGLRQEDRETVLGAASIARAAIASYWFGGSFPEEQLKALREQEEKLVTTSNRVNLYPTSSVSGNGIREKLTGTSVLSYVEVDGEMYGAVVSPATSGVQKLGSSKAIYDKAQMHLAELVSGSQKGKTADHLKGDDLRNMLINPFREEITGVGKYLVVAPTKLTSFTFSSLPDQRDGLRFLADTRRITTATSLEAVFSGLGVYGEFDIDMLAIGRPSIEKDFVYSNMDHDSELIPTGNADSPSDLEMVRLHFSDVSKFLIGEAATKEEFLKSAPTARYIYLTEIPASSDGGFSLVNGDVSLSDIRSLNLQAMTVFISPHPDVDVQAARVDTLLQAGVKSVVVQTWQLPIQGSRSILDTLFVSLKRNDPLIIAMDKARQKYIKDQSKEKFVNNPGVWGGFCIFGQP